MSLVIWGSHSQYSGWINSDIWMVSKVGWEMEDQEDIDYICWALQSMYIIETFSSVTQSTVWPWLLRAIWSNISGCSSWWKTDECYNLQLFLHSSHWQYNHKMFCVSQENRKSALSVLWECLFWVTAASLQWPLLITSRVILIQHF